MQDFIENLKIISGSIEVAQKTNNYDEILRLDRERRDIMDKIFANGIKKLSEENIKKTAKKKQSSKKKSKIIKKNKKN